MNKEKLIKLAIIIFCLLLLLIVMIKNKNTTYEDSLNNSVNKNISNKTVETLSDGTKINVSSKLLEEKVFSAYKVSNIQITEKDGIFCFLADIENVSKIKQELTMIEITFYDQAGNVIRTLNGIVTDIAPGEITQLNSTTTENILNVENVSFKVID